LDYYVQAIQQAEANGLHRSRAHVIVNRALALAAAGNTGGALNDINEILPSLKSENDDYAATALFNSGLIWADIGDQQQERRCYEEALRWAPSDDRDGLRRKILKSLPGAK
jgi:tetratricopeptide (TPR) repeat protein